MTDETQPQDDALAAVLVEVEPGLACLFGDDVPKGLELVYPPLLPNRATTQIGTAVGTALVGANLATQVAGAASSFQGLVRLTPETLEALQTLTPLTKDGANLGTLVDASGQFAHSLQWVPADTAALTAGLATVGPAVALLGLQVQLAAITSLVQGIMTLTDELLLTARIERWAEVAGQHEAMLKAVEEARHVGAVTDPIWQNVAAQEASLGKLRNEFREKVDAHLLSLQGMDGHRERWEYIRHHGDAILRDTQALLQAQAAWFTYQAIRAGHLYHRSDSDPHSGKLLEKVVADARTVHDQDLEATDELLKALYWQLSLMAELPGKPTLPFGKDKRAAQDVARASRTLLDQLNVLQDAFGLSDPPVPTAPIAVFQDDVPDLLPRVLRWHLRSDEELLALGSVKGQGWPARGGSYVAVTNQRLLVADKSALEGRGEVGDAVPVSDIRYVRYRSAEDGGQNTGRLEITTPERDLSLTFEDWASEETHQDDAARLAQLVRSSMSLPESEVPSSPLAQEGPAPGIRLAFVLRDNT